MADATTTRAVDAEPPASPPAWKRITGVADRNFVWVLLLGLAVAATIANPIFITPINLTNIMVAAVSLGCLTLAQALVLITGHMDLSTEANLILTSIVAGILLIPPPTGNTVAPGGFGAPWPLVVVVMIALSASVGLANGLMVTKLKMNPFMTTLAMLVGLSGLSLAIGQGRFIINLDMTFRWAGSGYVGPIPAAVIFLVLAFVVVGLMLNRTRFGRHLYAVGSNRAATRASGVDDDRVIILAYVICGLLVGLAAFLLMGRLGTAGPGIASGQLFISIAAAVLGGVSLFGGRGTVLGILGGLLLMGTVTNALNMAQVPSTLVNVVYGGIILVAVFVDAVRSRRTTMT